MNKRNNPARKKLGVILQKMAMERNPPSTAKRVAKPAAKKSAKKTAAKRVAKSAAVVDLTAFDFLPSPFSVGAPKVISASVGDVAVLCDVRGFHKTAAASLLVSDHSSDFDAEKSFQADSVSFNRVVDSIKSIGQTTPIPVVKLSSPSALVDPAHLHSVLHDGVSTITFPDGHSIVYWGDTLGWLDGERRPCFFDRVCYLGFAGGNTRLAALRHLGVSSVRLAVYSVDLSTWFDRFQAWNFLYPHDVDGEVRPGEIRKIPFVAPLGRLQRSLSVWGLAENTVRVGMTFGQRLYPLALIWRDLLSVKKLSRVEATAKFVALCGTVGVCQSNAYHAIRAHNLYGVEESEYVRLTRSSFLAAKEGEERAKSGGGDSAVESKLPEPPDWAVLSCAPVTNNAYPWVVGRPGHTARVPISGALKSVKLDDNDNLRALANRALHVARAMHTAVEIRIQRPVAAVSTTTDKKGGQKK